MKCPVCCKYGLTDEMSVSKHILGVFDQAHTDWLDSHGFKPAISLLNKGGTSKLAGYLATLKLE